MDPEEEENSYIRAVVGDPDSDRPRLDYADWLISHGQPERGRLIQVQCDLAALRQEEAGLLERHAAEWGRPLAACGAETWAFHRGFPEEIQITSGWLRRSHDRIAEITPITGLHVVAATDAFIEEFCRSDVGRGLRKLTVNNRGDEQLGPAGVRLLAACPHLAGLRELTLNTNRGASGVAEAIARSPYFGNLSRLRITDPSSSALDRSDWEQLVHSPTLRNLADFQWNEQQMGEFVLKFARTEHQKTLSGVARPPT